MNELQVEYQIEMGKVQEALNLGWLCLELCNIKDAAGYFDIASDLLNTIVAELLIDTSKEVK